VNFSKRKGVILAGGEFRAATVISCRFCNNSFACELSSSTKTTPSLAGIERALTAESREAHTIEAAKAAVGDTSEAVTTRLLCATNVVAVFGT